MAKAPRTPPTQTVFMRPGVSPFRDLGVGWGGMNTEDDPGALLPHELLEGHNIRQQKSKLVNRPGLHAIADVGQPVTWMGEVPCNPSSRLWFTTFGCFYGLGGSGGTQLLFLDPLANPILQVYGSFRADTSRFATIGKFGDTLFLHDKTALREITAILPPAGLDISNLTPTPPQIPTLDFPGYTIRWGKEFSGRYYLGLENDVTPASSKIVEWDGLGWKDDITGIDPPVAAHVYDNRNVLVVGFGAASAHIRYRTAGAAPGTWATVALAGMVTSPYGHAMQEVGPDLFIASGNRLIHRLTPAFALTLVRTIASADNAGNGITGLCLHDALLHYIWNEASPDYEAHIGRHDPLSTAANEWVDDYRDLTAAVAQFKRATACASFQNQQIYIGGEQAWVIATAPGDIRTSNIETVNSTGAPGSAHPVLQFLRHPS